MGNELSSFTANDLRSQLEQSRETIDEFIQIIQSKAERRARELIKRELLKMPPSVTEELKSSPVLDFEARQYFPGYLDFVKKMLSKGIEEECVYSKLTGEKKVSYPYDDKSHPGKSTGFMEFYLSRVACFGMMSTAADLNVMLQLAKSDLPRGTETRKN